MKNIFLGGLFLLFTLSSTAQDIHFSQFFASPLTLNPADAGYFREDWRVSGIHRAQWNSIDAGFNTTALGFDMNFKGGKLSQDQVGVALNFYNDDMAGILKHQTISLAGAYHRTLDGQKRHHLSIGIQGGYSQKNYNSSTWKFPDQYDQYKYDPNSETAENLDFNNIPNLNIHAGFIYAYRLWAENHVSLGFATYQIGTPTESLVGDNNELGARYSVELSGNFNVTPKFRVFPHILYMNQSRAKDLNPGLELSYEIIPFLDIKLGAWYRTDDAMIGLIGLGYKNIEARVSYDQTVSALTEITGASNLSNPSSVSAWEASIIIKGVLNRAVAKEYTVPCGIF